MPETKTSFHIRRLTVILLGAAAVLVAIGVGWFATGHLKHGLLFLALAAGVLLGAWFSTGETQLKSRRS